MTLADTIEEINNVYGRGDVVAIGSPTEYDGISYGVVICKLQYGIEVLKYRTDGLYVQFRGRKRRINYY